MNNGKAEMARHEIKTGFTLTEILVVVVIMSLLIGIALPTAKEILNSFSSSSGVKSVIGAALANARATAMSRRKYVGLRFQEDLKGNHYIIFIVHDTGDSGLANGFVAVAGRNPMRLPVNVGLMDLKSVTRTEVVGQVVQVSSVDITENDLVDAEVEVRDTKTFSIVFSPSGKLVQHQVRVRRTNDSSADRVFNTNTNVDNGGAMFYQDDYFVGKSPDLGIGPEKSRIGFIIYDKTEFKRINSGLRWTDYLQYLAEVYVNPYTGEIVNR
jgi:prepilin-type N-terminal cleavage/methylation domain-containing protein